MEKHAVVIVGSGPAGYTAAVYAARANLNPVLFTGMQPGGQLTITTDVENYPGFPKGILGPEMMELFREPGEAVRDPDPRRHRGARRSVEAAVSCGVGGARAARRFADHLHRRDRQVAGPPLGESALRPRRLGLRHLRRLLLPQQARAGGRRRRHGDGRGQLPDQDVQQGDRGPPARHLPRQRGDAQAGAAQPQDRLGVESRGGRGARQQGGTRPRRAHQEPGDGRREELDAQGLFIAIGHQPNTELFKGQLDMDEVGYIKVEAGSTRTNVPGVFAAGDAADPTYRQAVTAAGTGCMAAIDAERFLGAHGH